MHDSQYLINQLRGSQYVTWSPTWEECWLQNSSVHQDDDDHEFAWLQNPMVHKHNNFFKNDELGQNYVSGYKLLKQTLLNTCATCIHFDGP